MLIVGTGIDYSTEALLIDPIDERVFVEKILESFPRNAERVGTLKHASTTVAAYRWEIERGVIDLGDPRAAGWTFLINGKDPQRNDIIDAIRPLAEHRGMVDPKRPLVFNGEALDEWVDWMDENYYMPAEELAKAPHYILIVGSPDQVPFHFQSFLDCAASVGRVDFDSLEDLKTYVEKVIRLEQADSPVVARESVFFATDHGLDIHGEPDSTVFSRLYMAEPLAEYVRTEHGIQTTLIAGDEATKEQLLESLHGTRPALVYTASHGTGASGESLAIQKRVNGAICCQRVGSEPLPDRLFAADDVSLDEPFLEGAVFFQFACFGYGTSAESDFAHWLEQSMPKAPASFVAALPKRLLAHPRGPIAFIGHVDVALLHGFDDPHDPYVAGPWHRRITPFLRALDGLLRVQPAGRAMEDLNMRYNLCNAKLTQCFDLFKRGKVKDKAKFDKELAETFLFRSDAQNYMIFGDPAAHLRIPAA